MKFSSFYLISVRCNKFKVISFKVFFKLLVYWSCWVIVEKSKFELELSNWILLWNWNYKELELVFCVNFIFSNIKIMLKNSNFLTFTEKFSKISDFIDRKKLNFYSYFLLNINFEPKIRTFSAIWQESWKKDEIVAGLFIIGASWVIKAFKIFFFVRKKVELLGCTLTPFRGSTENRELISNSFEVIIEKLVRAEIMLLFCFFKTIIANSVVKTKSWTVVVSFFNAFWVTSTAVKHDFITF